MNDIDRLARETIQGCLDGTYTTNGQDPGECGHWAGPVEAIIDAYEEDGATTARTAYETLARQRPALRDLISAEPMKTSDGEAPPLPMYAAVPASLGADASPWLDEYIQFSRQWSPRAFDDFHEAAGIFILSTIAGRRVMLHFGGPRYGNLYIALTARTSLYAKSTTAKIGNQTLQSADLDWMLAPDEATPQAFIRHLTVNVPEDLLDKISREEQTRIENRIAIQGARGWYYEEFGEKLAAMRREGGVMADFRGHLRRFDDCPNRYEYATIHRGSEIVENPYLALLVNVTPADMKPLARRGASMWNDGFWARFAFVCPPGNERKRDRWPKGERVIPVEIVDPLRQWHKRLGLSTARLIKNVDEKTELEFEYKPPTACVAEKGVFDAFYAYHDGLLDIVEQYPNTDLDGNYARFAEKALRVSILLASLENDNKIELRHWARAQAIAERWRGGLHALYQQLTEADPSAEEQMEEKILQFVTKLGDPTAREVGQRIKGLDTAAAQTWMDKLAGAGILDRKKSKRSFRYSLPKEN